jgi:hypothetical protein
MHRDVCTSGIIMVLKCGGGVHRLWLSNIREPVYRTSGTRAGFEVNSPGLIHSPGRGRGRRVRAQAMPGICRQAARLWLHPARCSPIAALRNAPSLVASAPPHGRAVFIGSDIAHPVQLVPDVPALAPEHQQLRGGCRIRREGDNRIGGLGARLPIPLSLTRRLTRKMDFR